MTPRQSYEWVTEDRAQDSILERLTELDDIIATAQAEKARLNGYLRGFGSPYAPKLLDRDEVGADEDNDRISRERADEKAAAGMGRIGS